MAQENYPTLSYDYDHGRFNPSSPVPSYAYPASPVSSPRSYTSPPMSPVSVDSSQFSGYNDYNTSDPSQMKTGDTNTMISKREATAMHYEVLKKEKLRRKQGSSARVPQKSRLLTQPPPKKAETTRKVKVVEDEEGVETVHEMKCQMDLDREEEAKKKALRMLELGFM